MSRNITQRCWVAVLLQRLSFSVDAHFCKLHAYISVVDVHYFTITQICSLDAHLCKYMLKLPMLMHNTSATHSISQYRRITVPLFPCNNYRPSICQTRQLPTFDMSNSTSVPNRYTALLKYFQYCNP